MSFAEQLAAAKSAPPKTKDVTITLNDEVSARREELELKLENAASATDRRLGAPDPVQPIKDELAALMQEAVATLVTLRFTRMPGDQWADITSRNPMRLDAPVDAHYGYNMQGVVTMAAPKSGVRVEHSEDGTEVLVPLIIAPGGEDIPPINEWRDLFSVISGHEFQQIEEAIYRLNEYDPAARLNELKKASAALGVSETN